MIDHETRFAIDCKITNTDTMESKCFSQVTKAKEWAENANGVSYNELMIKYDISSKGTLSYIINNKYKTVV